MDQCCWLSLSWQVSVLLTDVNLTLLNQADDKQ